MNIYISAPITGRTSAECEMKFNQAKSDISKRGHFAVSPWDISKSLPVTFEHSDYLSVDIEVMRRCDAVLFLADWHKSKGCRHERECCHHFGILILDSIEEIPV